MRENGELPPRTRNVATYTSPQLAQRVVVAYASPGGKLETLCRRLLANGKPVLTFDSPYNAGLLASGAQAVESWDFRAQEG